MVYRILVLGLFFVSCGLNLLLLGQQNARIIYVDDEIDSKFKDSETLLHRQMDEESKCAINPHNYRYKINEPQICESNSPLILLVVVCTGMVNFDERKAIRNTWGSMLKENSEAKLIFMLGSGSDPYVQGEIESESRQHGDIIQENFTDSYRNLSLKSVGVLKWVKYFCSNVRLIFKADDDIYVNVPNLMDLVMKIKSVSSPFIMGYIFKGAKPVVDKTSKWYTPKEDYNESFYPDYVSGTSYIMSNSAVKQLYTAALNTKLFWLEDIYITGICRRKATIRLSHHPGIAFYKRKSTSCAYKASITGHNVSPKRMLEIHSQLSSPNTFRCNM